MSDAPTQAKPTRFIGYCRVSTTGQRDDGISLQAQEARIRAWATAFGAELVDVIVDAGVSGKSLQRDGIKAALARLEAGDADGIVIYDISRLTRSIVDLANLVRTHFETRYVLVSLSESIDTKTASGRMMIHLIGVFAQWFRENIAEKTKDAMAHLKREGVKVGRPPYGMKVQRDDVWNVVRDANGRAVLEDDPKEQAAIKAAVAWRASGLPLKLVAERLQARGHQTRMGVPWTEASVASILKRATWRETATSSANVI